MSRWLNFQRSIKKIIIIIIVKNCKNNTNQSPPLTGFHYMVHSLEPRFVIPSWSFFMLKSIANLYKETKLFNASVPQLCSQGSNNLRCLDIQRHSLICDVTAHYVSS